VSEQRSWAVSAVEVLADKRVRVVFATEPGGHKEEFVTRKFGVGRRGAKAAALAKFCTKAGLADDVMVAYSLIRHLPHDYKGPLLFTPVIEEVEPRLSVVS
jgi:hypothetical protein